MPTDKKISELTPNTSITGIEEVPTERGGSNYKNTYTDLKTWILTGLGIGVNSVTGNGVGGTPTEVIMTFPNTSEVIETVDKNYVTDVDKVVLGNTSNVNTGDQDLSSLALKSNVLELDNTTVFTPSSDYEPATRKFVLDNSGGGGGSLIEENTQSIRGGSTSSVNTSDFSTLLGLGDSETLGSWSTGFGNLLKVPQSSTYIGYGIGDSSRQNDSQILGQRIPHVGRGCVYMGFRITDLSNDKSSATYNSILIGREITLDATNHKQTVGIGSNQVFGNDSGNLINTTLIGNEASSFVDPVYGDPGSDNTGVGFAVKPHSWRATCIGAYAAGYGTSSTSIGMGSYTDKAHGLTIGRGGYNDKQNASLIYQSGEVPQIYFGAMHGAHTNPAMPLSETIDFSVELNAGDYVSTITTVDGLDVRSTPLNTDTRGGHLRIGGGVGTDTAEGGEIRLSTSPSGLVGGMNSLNAWRDALIVDASKNVDTRISLLDVTDNTLKRVEFGVDDSAGVGYKTLRVQN